MDPRDRADAILARARARGAFVVTPESAVSPMDAASTLQIPRAVVAANDERDEDPETTMVVPGAIAHGRHRAVPAQEPHVADNLPAIAQEALTDVVSPPGPRSRQRRLEQHQNMVAQQQQQQPEPEPEPPPQPQPEELDGLVPTVKQPPTTHSTLSQRLDG